MDPFSVDVDEVDPLLDDDGFFSSIARGNVTEPDLARRPPIKSRETAEIAEPMKQQADEKMNQTEPSEADPEAQPPRCLPSNGRATRKSTPRLNPWGRQSYTELISQAILASPDQRLKLPQIYCWISQNIPYFTEKDGVANANWKNSVRHTLSLPSSPFMREPDPRMGKSSWWSLSSPSPANQKPQCRRRPASADGSEIPKRRHRSAPQDVTIAREKTPKLAEVDRSAEQRSTSDSNSALSPQRCRSESNVSAAGFSDSGVSSVFAVSGDVSDDDEMDVLLSQALKFAGETEGCDVFCGSILEEAQPAHEKDIMATSHPLQRHLTPGHSEGTGQPAPNRVQAQYEMTGMSGNLVFLRRTAAAAVRVNQQITPEFLIWDVKQNTYRLPEDQRSAGILVNPQDGKQPLLWQPNQQLNTIVEGVPLGMSQTQLASNVVLTSMTAQSTLQVQQRQDEHRLSSAFDGLFSGGSAQKSAEAAPGSTHNCRAGQSAESVASQDVTSHELLHDTQSTIQHNLNLGTYDLDFLPAISAVDSTGFGLSFDSEGNISF